MTIKNWSGVVMLLAALLSPSILIGWQWAAAVAFIFIVLVWIATAIVLIDSD